MKKKLVVIFISIIFVLFSSFLIYKHNVESSFNEFVLMNDTVLNEDDVGKNEYVEEITSLQQEYHNEDVVGILEFENSDFKVPIVQSSDNKYYLKHLPNKEYSIMGSIFLDYRVDIDTSQKILIYGHNSAFYDMPFKILENYYDTEYLNSHKNVFVKTKSQVKKYEIFSLYIATDDFTYMNIEFDNNGYKDHLKYLKNNSMLNIDTEVNHENILILQTCSTHKGYRNYKKKYLVLAFKEVNYEK